jgi:hypothetical protein
MLYMIVEHFKNDDPLRYIGASAIADASRRTDCNTFRAGSMRNCSTAFKSWKTPTANFSINDQRWSDIVEFDRFPDNLLQGGRRKDCAAPVRG